MKVDIEADCPLRDTLQCFHCGLLSKLGVEEGEKSRWQGYWFLFLFSDT